MQIGICIVRWLLINLVRFIFFGLCLEKEDKEIDCEKILKTLNENKEKDIQRLDIKNKEINKIEEKILKYKKVTWNKII